LNATQRPYITFGAPTLDEDEIAEVVACLRSGWLGTGPRVAEFESGFASYQGVGRTQVAAVNSCTAALHLCMLALDLEPGSEVITTPLTFCASVNAIIHAGLVPVLADVDPRSQCIDPEAIEDAITPRTGAILPVHFAGRSCAMDPIMALAARRGLKVVEDCAHAIETEYHGRKAGTFGEFGCYSFYATKNVTTGEGGMILGSNERLVARTKVLALHGMSTDAWRRFSDDGYRHYEVTECGFKYNMMDLQAALGIHQLRKVEAHWQRRLEIWNAYMDAFAQLDVELPLPFEPETRHGLHLFTIGITGGRSSRDDVLVEFHRSGIGTGVHYMSVSEHPFYKARFGWDPRQWPSAMAIGRSTLSLPLSPYLSDGDVGYIIEQARRILSSR
jgi:dTDP-4-amino-4,6-dideoxygalactose transaminase